MRSAALLALAVALTGCSLLGITPTPTPTVGTHADPFPANPAGAWDAVMTVVAADLDGGTEVSVDEAVARPRDGALLLVRGALFADDAYGHVWLCSRAERNPDSGGPLCAGAILQVVNESAGAGQTTAAYIADLLAAADVGELQQAGTIRWSADAAVFGSVQ